MTTLRSRDNPKKKKFVKEGKTDSIFPEFPVDDTTNISIEN